MADQQNTIGINDTKSLYIWIAFFIVSTVVIGLTINALTSEVQNMTRELREIKTIMRQQAAK
jgi:heme exporter protein D